ncbi:MAG: threonine--tRNA ligase [Patescibacteria group bacterium]|jgi:threonyl-tRNA synthetase
MNDKILHTTEHVLQIAMAKIYPNIKRVMGPAIENGFYFDFDLEQKITNEDLPKIEAEMLGVINQKLSVTREEVSLKQARELFKDNQYKLDRLDEIEKEGTVVIIYRIGEDFDLCAGPHVNNTSEIKAFKLLNIAGAYYKGDEKNKMLTRIYGTAFGSKEALEEFLKNRELAEQNNHRKIAKEQELFEIYPELGKGLPIWLPNGYVIRRELEDYMIRMERRAGYKHILSPVIHRDELFKISGHLSFYKDSMYSPMEIEGEKYYLKPMNCPAGMLVYKSKLRSYKELPLKIGEFGTVYRFEKSGELQGMQRVRGFTQNDAHIYCTKEQLLDEFEKVFDLLLQFYKDVGFDKVQYVLALSDPDKEKYKFCGSRKDWEWAEDSLRQVMKNRGVTFTEEVGEAAFYGPKIDVKAVNVFGKADAISTIQVDFNLPERFDLTYTDREGNKQRPYVIHRALIGSFERFFAFLIEHFGGAFPVWLSPVQVMIIPINSTHVEYAQKLKELMVQEDIRVEIDDRNESMGLKIRDAQVQKIPYMVVVGDNEIKSHCLSLRLRSGEQINGVTLEEMMDKVKKIYLTRSLELW